MIRIEHYINGERKASVPSAYRQSLNPYNQQPVAEFPFAGKSEADEAVSSARSALNSWRSLPSTTRADYLDAIAAETGIRRDTIAAAITASCGKPLSEAAYDVQDAIDCYRYYADVIRTIPCENSRPVAVADPDFTAHLQREAVGVVALITPWNFPTVTTSWKLAPALAAGCTVVLKPSEYTPLPESYLADICDAAGLPAGVVNMIYGAADTGSALISHPQVRKISFTGSTATGAHIARQSADDIKNLSLELGGKSAILVFDDADIDTALSAVTAGILFNNGQMCSATSRLLVQEGIASELLKKLQQQFAAMKPSDPARKDTLLGPLANTAQFEKVCSYLDIARQEGLHTLTGGKVYPHPQCSLMIEPTIYTDVPLSSRLWQEEIFGPVLCCRTFSSEEEAITLANDSEYGLAATVISGDEEYAGQIASQLEAGHIWLNCDQKVLVETSWGGMKKSSLGRELGPWGLSAFTEIKHITRRSAAKL